MKKIHEIKVEINIAAPAQHIYCILTNVERWPAWTRSVKKARVLNRGYFGPGAKVRLCQPGLLPATWTVTEVRENNYFTWCTWSAGTKIIGRHIIKEGNNGSDVILIIEYKGLLSALIRRLTYRFTRNNMEIEAAGLKSYAESTLIHRKKE